MKKENFISLFIDYTKAVDYVDHNKLWEILKEIRIRDHLTCILRNLYAGQEAIVRTVYGTTDQFKTGKGAYCPKTGKAVYCHPTYLTSMQSTS